MSTKYDDYLNSHIYGVAQSVKWFRKNAPDMIDTLSRLEIAEIINMHDLSKEGIEEYKAYERYFYSDNKTAKIKEDFDYAWLHHIHNNPHHWQYWVLINDEDGTKVLPMPYRYIFEMICDWWSFSWNNGNLYEIFNWYDTHKDNMMLHENTRETVEEILGRIEFELDKQQSNPDFDHVTQYNQIKEEAVK